MTATAQIAAQALAANPMMARIVQIARLRILYAAAIQYADEVLNDHDRAGYLREAASFRRDLNALGATI